MIAGTVAVVLSTEPAHSIVISKWIEWLLVAAATIPLAVRRRWPEAALICIGAAVTTATLLELSLAPSPLLALPLYSVFVKYSRRQSLMVAAGVELVFLLAFIGSEVLRAFPSDFTFDMILVGATWFVCDSIRSRRAYQLGLVAQERERQRQALDRTQRAVVEERMEIARELHDVIAHSLSVIAIQSGVGRHVIDRQPDEARAALAAIEDTSRTALGELRRVLGVLRRDDGSGPELTPAPTLLDLGDLVETVRNAGVPVELVVTGSTTLPAGLELSVYRIVQEALTNVVKHARSARTWVCLNYGEEQLVVRVTNAPTSLARYNQNGPVDLRDRHGIIGMAERADTYGGTLTAGVLPDGGFEVCAQLPIGHRP